MRDLALKPFASEVDGGCLVFEDAIAVLVNVEILFEEEPASFLSGIVKDCARGSNSVGICGVGEGGDCEDAERFHCVLVVVWLLLLFFVINLIEGFA